MRDIETNRERERERERERDRDRDRDCGTFVRDPCKRYPPFKTSATGTPFKDTRKQNVFCEVQLST